jgi:NAD(P)H dehydrogenase (quinone)
MNALIARGYFVGRRALLGLTTGGTIERFSDGGSYGEMKDVLYSVRRCSSNISDWK